MTAPAELALGHRLSAREAGLWAVAAATVVLAHVAISFAVQAMADLPPAPDATEEAMVVELAPLPFASSEAVPAEIVSEEEPAEQLAPEEVEAEPVEEETVAEAVPEETPEPVPPEETPVAAETPPETVEADVAEPVEDEVVEQEVAEAVEPEVIVPMPRPDRVVEEPRPEPAKKRVERRPDRKTAQTPKPARKADTRQEARSRPEASVKSNVAKAPTVNPARWNSAVRAAIARRAGRARGMKGTVQVQFVVNRSGSIVSARVAGSSGNGRLDSAALGMVRSARVPAPPPGLPGASHSFMIPLSFR